MRSFNAVMQVFVWVVVFSSGAQAQVSQWNHFVQDEALELAFHRALNQVSIEFIQDMDEQNRSAALVFLDSQKDISLLLTSSAFRHKLVAASRAKATFIVDYQALTSRDVTIRIGLGAVGVQPGSQIVDYGSVSPEVPGDGGVMLCPVNKSGLKFMYGALAITSLDDGGNIRVREDGAEIEEMRDRILALTYEIYGHAPQQ